MFNNHEEVDHANNHADELAAFYEDNENLADPALRRDYFGRMDENQFIDLTQQVASIIRTGDSNGRQEYDGEAVGLMTLEVPDQRDKAELIKETWHVARDFLQDPSLEDNQALHYAGLTVAGGYLIAHPNIDGNGRGARVLEHIIEEGSNEQTQEVLSRLLSSEGNADWHVAPASELKRIMAEDIPVPKELDGLEDIDWEDDGLLENGAAGKNDNIQERLTESLIRNKTILTFANHTDARARDILAKYTEPAEDGTGMVLKAAAAVTELVNDQEQGIGYAAQLVEADRLSRADSVYQFLRAMQHDQSKPLPTRFVENIKRTQEDTMPVRRAQIKAYGHIALEGGEMLPRDFAAAHNEVYSRIKRERNELE